MQLVGHINGIPVEVSVSAALNVNKVLDSDNIENNTNKPKPLFPCFVNPVVDQLSKYCAKQSHNNILQYARKVCLCETDLRSLLMLTLHANDPPSLSLCCI